MDLRFTICDLRGLAAVAQIFNLVLSPKIIASRAGFLTQRPRRLARRDAERIFFAAFAKTSAVSALKSRWLAVWLRLGRAVLGVSCARE